MFLVYNVYKFFDLFGVEVGNVNVFVPIEVQVVEAALAFVDYQLPIALTHGDAVHSRKFPI